LHAQKTFIKKPHVIGDKVPAYRKKFFIMYFTRKVKQYRYGSPREETREVSG
jgi:hypothetical protein